MAQQTLTFDYATKQVILRDLTLAEQAIYDAQQPVGTAQAATDAATLAVKVQHIAALASVKAAITANSTTTSNDITALTTIVTNLQAGTAPTNAQLLQVIRFLVRALAALNS